MGKLYVIRKIQSHNYKFDILKCPRCNHEWETFEWTDCPRCRNRVVMHKTKEEEVADCDSIKY